MAMISCAVAPRSANRVDVAFLNPCEVQWEGSPHCSKFVPKAGGLQTFYSNHESIRVEVNARFLATESVARADFFRTVEKRPLSAMQMRAILTDDDATLVLAGAGSGKTSVIVGKVAYLLHRALRGPQEILTLAFSRDAKSELETRIEKRVGQPVHVSTFHALGLAIIGKSEGRRPDVSVLSTDQAKLRRFIKNELERMLDTPNLRARVIAWFLEYLVPYRGAEEFQTAGRMTSIFDLNHCVR